MGNKSKKVKIVSGGVMVWFVLLLFVDGTVDTRILRNVRPKIGNF